MVEICLVNLGATWEYKYYKVSSVEELNEAYKDMEDAFNADEIEIQGMSHSDRTVEHLGELFEIAEENDADIETVIEIFEAIDCITTTREVIENGSYCYYMADDKESAFMEYIEEIDFLHDVPDHLVNYIDYKKIMRDFEIEGLQIERLDYNKYLFIF